MNKEERFEIFNEDGKWVIKDNEQLPHLLDLYKSCVRLNEFATKVADLEAKLAESEKDRLMWQEMYKSADRQNKEICETDIYPLQNELSQIKQQLAEKEKERHEEWKTGKEWKWEWQRVNQKLEQANQGKISFCIEQLEKVKEFFAKRKDDYLYLKDEIKAISYNQYVDFVNEVEIFELKVDNQIKALKESQK